MPMSAIDQFLKESDTGGATHPLIRTWGWLLQEPHEGEIHCRVDRRRQGLSYLPTKLWLEFTLPSGEPKAECSDWDFELNGWLIEQKIKAIDEENESIRFQLVLRELLQKTEIRLGDGYFSAVLIDVLKKTGLAAEPQITHILAKVGNYSPYHGSAYGPASETIKAAFSKCARSLKELGYGDEAVLNILVWSIYRYLDDRFSVTNRAILGMD
jgi:hypothetical protein